MALIVVPGWFTLALGCDLLDNGCNNIAADSAGTRWTASLKLAISSLFKPKINYEYKKEWYKMEKENIYIY